MDAGQDLHERALPRAVLAHQRMDLAATQLQGAVLQRLGGAERLGEGLHVEYDGVRRGSLACDVRRTGPLFLHLVHHRAQRPVPRG